MKIQLGTILVLISLACCQAHAADWHVPQSMVRYRLEPDTTQARVADVFTDDLDPAAPNPARMRLKSQSPEQNYVWIDNRIYSKAEPVEWPSGIVFELSSAFERFVARAGVDDRADENAAVTFKVLIDDKPVYQSPVMRRGMPPAQVNLALPSGSRKIRLVTEGTGSGRRKLAAWGNGGFTLRGRAPAASLASIWPAGFDYQQFEPVVFSGAGQRVGCQLLHNAPGEPISFLFDTSGGGIYFAYLVRPGTLSPLPWQARAGLTLETRYTPAIDPKCHDLKGLGEIWTRSASPVNKSPVGQIHHGSPPHGLLSSHYEKDPQSALGLYYYEGYFKTDKQGAYSFATDSHWGSYLSVDGTLVIEWPGSHGWQGGQRGEKQGTVLLSPGVHKLEYLNCSPWTVMFTLAAWQREEEKPPSSNLRILTDADFLPLGYYQPTAVGYPKCYGSMTWQTVADIRAEQNGPPAVTMQFKFLPAEGRPEAECRWQFDDGASAAGSVVNHLFFVPGLRTVTLAILDKNQKELTAIKQVVAVYPRWDQIWRGPDDLGEFEKQVLALDLTERTLDDLIGLFRLADELDCPQVKAHAARTLASQAGKLAQDSKFGVFALELAETLQSWTLRDYSGSLGVYQALTGPQAASGASRQQALLGQAQLLIRTQQKPKEGLAALNQVGSTRQLDQTLAVLAERLRAEACFLTGQDELARLALQRAAVAPPSAAMSVRHQALLRQARNQVAASGPDDLDETAGQLEQILTEDPARLTSADLTGVLIDLHLKRQEYQLAWHYENLLDRLDSGEIHRPDLLLRQIRTLLGLNKAAQAREVFQQLNDLYPYSPILPQARDLLLNAKP